ncbi:MAG TPA: phosphate signaling complex protein PhoU [Candidatus Dormibacteraeota bacterium]|jgi:phosphate transport system protein|nr:phosphate signaling complex protein PhoU [Candidatus Dormibacteraeota bacterium]
MEFETELASLRETLLRMGGQVESQIDAATRALRERDRGAADLVRRTDQQLNELFRQIREQCLMVIATQQPVARDLRTLMGIVYISTELERMGDYAVRIARITGTICGLPDKQLQPEFGLMADLTVIQVHDILDALIEMDEVRAREVAAKDDDIDRLYHRLFDTLVEEIGEGGGPEAALRGVTLMQAAHSLERIADRVTNVAEDIVFWESGQVVELG